MPFVQTNAERCDGFLLNFHWFFQLSFVNEGYMPTRNDSNSTCVSVYRRQQMLITCVIIINGLDSP